jgi:hypothetical protein
MTAQPREQTKERQEDLARMDTKADSVDSLTAAQNEAIRTLVREVLDGYRTGEVGDIDGGWLQDRALGLGLLHETGSEDEPLYCLAGFLDRG